MQTKTNRTITCGYMVAWWDVTS